MLRHGIVVNKRQHQVNQIHNHHQAQIITSNKLSIHWIQLMTPIRTAKPKSQMNAVEMMEHFWLAIHQSHCKQSTNIHKHTHTFIIKKKLTFPHFIYTTHIIILITIQYLSYFIFILIIIIWNYSKQQQKKKIQKHSCVRFVLFWFDIFSVCLVCFYFISPEFSYRPGLSVLSEDSNNAVPLHGAGGPPNRPLPPTPDDDDQQGDRTLIMKRVSFIHKQIKSNQINL